MAGPSLLRLLRPQSQQHLHRSSATVLFSLIIYNMVLLNQPEFFPKPNHPQQWYKTSAGWVATRWFKHTMRCLKHLLLYFFIFRIPMENLIAGCLEKELFSFRCKMYVLCLVWYCLWVACMGMGASKGLYLACSYSHSCKLTSPLPLCCLYFASRCWFSLVCWIISTFVSHLQ